MDPRLIILFVALALAAVLDIATKKIPNWLTFSLLLVGLLATSTYGEGFVFGLTGAGVAFVLHYAMWQIGLEGAGDAKLMMGVGAILGWHVMIEATLWRYMLLFPYAIVAITVTRRWGSFRQALLWTAKKVRGRPVGERPEPLLMPFGPLIALAVPLAIYTSYLELI